ncbi:hypothetical protein Pint_05257 [Pistacia integerrima]|uniref:Uncharacterized protein n=1 Tax=Pistacia integerrima TaxID=434235 RepID=A0ACC0Z949_9ROSI|nr:hypothetical protein Pint_05257 [Pistacia integerrima]
MTLSLYVAASFSPSPKFSKFPPPSSSSSSCLRIVCRGGSNAPYAASEAEVGVARRFGLYWNRYNLCPTCLLFSNFGPLNEPD